LRLQNPLRQFLCQKMGEGFAAEKSWSALESALTYTQKPKGT